MAWFSFITNIRASFQFGHCQWPKAKQPWMKP